MAPLPNEGRNKLLRPHDQLREDLKEAARILAQKEPQPKIAMESARMLLHEVGRRYREASNLDAMSSVYAAVVDLSPLLPDDRLRKIILTERAMRWIAAVSPGGSVSGGTGSETAGRERGGELGRGRQGR